MRVPSTAFITAWLRYFAIFFCGTIVGFAVLTAVESHNFELVVLENQELRQKVTDLESAVNEFSKTADRKDIIRVITVIVQDADGKLPLDEAARLKLKERVASDLSSFKGMNVTERGLFDQLLLTKQLLNKKIYTGVNDKDYQIEIRMGSIVGSELRMWVAAKPYMGD